MSGFVSIIYYTSGSQMFWSQELFILLKIDKDPKELILEDFRRYKDPQAYISLSVITMMPINAV